MTGVRVSRLRRAAAAALLVSAPFAIEVIRGAATASAADPVNITWTAKSDPERVAPGAKGVLVISGKVRKTVHVYADVRFKVKPTAVPGVTYGFVEKSKPQKWTDPEEKGAEPEDVYFDAIEVKVPFTLAADAKLPLTVSATIEWSCCDETQCFAKATTKPPVGAEVKAPEEQAPPKEPPTPVSVPADPPGKSADERPADSPGAKPPAPPTPTAAPADSPSPPAAAGARKTFTASTTLKTDEVTITVVANEQRFVVTFAPADGHHLYPLGTAVNVPVSAEGVATPGVTWRAATSPTLADAEIHDPYDLVVPYTDSGGGSTALSIDVAWQVCLDSGTCRGPESPHRFTLDRSAAAPTLAAGSALGPIAPSAAVVGVIPPGGPDGARPKASSDPRASSGAAAPAAAASGSVPTKGILFPVVGKSEKLKDEGAPSASLLYLLGLFGTGILLSFTPCVLPLVPITVSIVGGGSATLSKSRLTFLISCYVLGLSVAFGTMGLAAAKAGASFSAAFQSPTALWVIAGVFGFLAFGMFGVFELQPPAWAQRLQGGAKGGNPIGAFLLGAMGALIASPCTGPVIAGLIVFTAESGNALLGFLMFFTLGLGMGVVFFAAGSLNLLMKPGPWMVWVRHGFGIILVGAALYYLRSGDKISTWGVIGLGFGAAVLAAVLIGRHLIKKEGEQPHAAYTSGVKVALLVVLATGAVALMLRAQAHDLTWTSVTSREQLVAEVEKAKKDGKVTVVDVWATWCKYCVRYDGVIEENADVKAGFKRLHRLRVDLSEQHPPWEEGVREGLDIPMGTQPFMVFIDSKGTIHRDLDLDRWHGDKAATELESRLEKLLPKTH